MQISYRLVCILFKCEWQNWVEKTQGSDPIQRTIGDWGKLGIKDMVSLPLSEKNIPMLAEASIKCVRHIHGTMGIRMAS